MDLINFNLISLFLLSLLLPDNNTTAHQLSRSCDPLFIHRNTKVECKVPGNSSINDCSTPQPVGTVVKYNCKIYYTPFDPLKQGTGNNHLKCDKNGKWNGIKSYQTFRCKDECGTIVRNADPLVINGQLSSKYSHPWHASVFRKKQGDTNAWEFICGGSLIRNQIVLSAAHCFAYSNTAVSEANDFRIVLGAISSDYSENAEKESGAKIYSIHRLYISENYDPKKGYQADIALIHLKENVEFSDYILPICLPNDYKVDVNAIKNGVQGEIAGFGVTETGKLSRTLRSIHLTVKSNSECHNSLQRVLTESQYCAGGRRADDSWKTVCNGDSGGGMSFLSEAEDLFYIHGIVSSGDAKSKESCQNYAVFTRVYPFVFWIRSVIEEISGEIARESRLNVPYPYTLTGTELESAEFTGLPREWENRVTTINIKYSSINLDILLESLNFAKPSQSLRISESKFEDVNALAKRRVILPYLTSFYLDVFGDNLEQNNQYDLIFNETFISSLLFFYKSYDRRDWKLQDILSLETDTTIILNIHKIFNYNRKSGELSLFGLPSSSEILRNARANPDFYMNSLILKNCDSIDVIDLIGTRTLKTLIIDNVGLSNLTSNSFVWIKNFKKLEILVLNTKDEIKLTLDILPQSIKHLSLSSKVSLKEESIVNRDNIFFPGEEIGNNGVKLDKVETFCCILCKMDEYIKTNLFNVFPNVENLIIETDISIGTEKIMKYSNNLKFIYIKNTNNNETLIMKKNSKRWTKVEDTLKYYKGILYNCNAQHQFWTSKEEYLTKKRLKSFEKQAVASDIYKFNGTNNNQRFQGIPPEIQINLQQIILSNLEVTPRVLLDSVSNAPKLNSLIMNNVSVIGSGWRSSFKTGSDKIEFKIEHVQFLNFTFEYVFKYVNGEIVSTVIPFQDLGRFKNVNYTNTLHRLFSDVNSIVIDKEEGATAYSYNSFVREMTYNGLHILNSIKNLGDEHPLKQFLPILEELRGIYKSDILPPDWKFIGVHSINKKLLETFFKDSITQFIGNLGVFQLVLKRFGKYLSLANLSLTGLREGGHYPPIQAIAISLIKNFEL